MQVRDRPDHRVPGDARTARRRARDGVVPPRHRAERGLPRPPAQRSVPRPSAPAEPTPRPPDAEVRPRRLSAAWVLPMSGAADPGWRGAHRRRRDSIVAIGPDGDGAAAPPTPSAPTGPPRAILPGLVNTHTHLELTGFAGQAEEADFPAWIRRIRALKAERTPAEFPRGRARRAGRPATPPASPRWPTPATPAPSSRRWRKSGGSGIAYHEVFGPHPDQLRESLAGLAAAGGRAHAGSPPSGSGSACRPTLPTP